MRKLRNIFSKDSRPSESSLPVSSQYSLAKTDTHRQRLSIFKSFFKPLTYKKFAGFRNNKNKNRKKSKSSNDDDGSDSENDEVIPNDLKSGLQTREADDLDYDEENDDGGKEEEGDDDDGEGEGSDKNDNENVNDLNCDCDDCSEFDNNQDFHDNFEEDFGSEAGADAEAIASDLLNFDLPDDLNDEIIVEIADLLADNLGDPDSIYLPFKSYENDSDEHRYTFNDENSVVEGFESDYDDVSAESLNDNDFDSFGDFDRYESDGEDWEVGSYCD